MKVAKKINTVLCDDVRNEVGNKLSLIGVYTKDIVFNEIPAIYSKLCFVIIIKELKELFTDVKLILKSPESSNLLPSGPISRGDGGYEGAPPFKE